MLRMWITCQLSVVPWNRDMKCDASWLSVEKAAFASSYSGLLGQRGRSSILVTARDSGPEEQMWRASLQEQRLIRWKPFPQMAPFMSGPLARRWKDVRSQPYGRTHCRSPAVPNAPQVTFSVFASLRQKRFWTLYTITLKPMPKWTWFRSLRRHLEKMFIWKP